MLRMMRSGVENAEQEHDDVEENYVEEDRSQDCDPHFARACTAEMHLDMSHEPLYARIHKWTTLCASLRKCARDRNADFARSCGVKMHLAVSEIATHCSNPIFLAVLEPLVRPMNAHLCVSSLCRDWPC